MVDANQVSRIKDLRGQAVKLANLDIFPLGLACELFKSGFKDYEVGLLQGWLQWKGQGHNMKHAHQCTNNASELKENYVHKDRMAKTLERAIATIRDKVYPLVTWKLNKALQHVKSQPRRSVTYEW